MKETFKFSARPRETEGGRRGTQNVPARHDPMMAVLDGSVVLGKLPPIPEQKEEMGEHRGGSDVLSDGWPSSVPGLFTGQMKNRKVF